MIRVFLGFDPRETIAFHVASNSIHALSTRPVSIAPLSLSQLRDIFNRPRDPKQSTDFSFTRFLVPFLCGFDGWAMFADCDILILRDIAELWDLRDERYAVQVVMHNHRPVETTKFLGQEQTRFERKNWSSLMLLNNRLCTALTPEYVGSAPGLDLHRFRWLESEELIGALPAAWNHLVDYDAASPASNLALLHYTKGGPWFPDCRTSGYADLWWQELGESLKPLISENIR